MHIIDQSRRKTPYSSVMNWIGHCFGGCCNGGANLEEVIQYRCGHKLNYLGDQEVIEGWYGELDRQSRLLETVVEEPEWQRKRDKERSWSAVIEGMDEKPKQAYHDMIENLPADVWSWSIPNYDFNQTGIEVEGE